MVVRGRQRCRERTRPVTVPQRQRVYPHAPVLQRLHGAGLNWGVGGYRRSKNTRPLSRMRARICAGRPLEPQPPV